MIAPAGPAARYGAACLSIFEDDCFHSQARPEAGARPRIAVSSFAPTDQVATVLDRDGWTISGVLVDHHPVEPAVGYRIERADTVVVISGDTAVCEGIYRLAEGADVLVHEALLSAAVSPALLEWNAGARRVGELAAVVEPSQLVLTHLIPAPTTPVEEAAFLAEMRVGGYLGTAHVAHDLLAIEIESPTLA